jgi:acetoin utilization protein AcuB
MQVSELMSRAVVTIDVSASGQEAVARMHGARVRHLPVTDERGLLVGIVTDRDLRHHLFSRPVRREIGAMSVEALLKLVPVREIMSAPVACVAPGDDVDTAARLMRERKVGSVPVVDGGRVVGIVTETDLLREIVRADGLASPEVEEIIVPYP